MPPNSYLEMGLLEGQSVPCTARFSGARAASSRKTPTPSPGFGWDIKSLGEQLCSNAGGQVLMGGPCSLATDEKSHQHWKTVACGSSAAERILVAALFCTSHAGGMRLDSGSSWGSGPSSARLRSRLAISEEQLGLSLHRQDLSELVLRSHEGPFHPMQTH